MHWQIFGGRSARRSGVDLQVWCNVFKASMLKWGGRSARYGVMVFKASMFNCGGVDLPGDSGVDLPNLV